MSHSFKKVFSLILSASLILVSVLPAMAAEIYWAPEDICEVVIGTLDFENSGASAIGGGTLVDGSTVVPGDTSHGTVNSSTGFIYLFTGKFVDALNNRSKVTISFDYYATASDNLRVEMRNIGTNEGTEVAETHSGQAKYWDQTQDLPAMAVTNDGKWHTFTGTIDIGKYLEEFILLKNDTLTFNNAGFLIRLSDGNQLYTDNFRVVDEPQVKAFINSPTYNYTWAGIESTDGLENVHKAVVNVDQSSDEFEVFNATASPGFFEDGGTYQATFKYKEDASNPYPMMRMWRFKNSVHSQITNWDSNGGYLYLTWEPEKEDFGNWNTITNTITLDATRTQDAKLISNGMFNLWWNTTSSWSDDMKGDYTVYIADFEIKRLDSVSDASVTVAFSEDQYVQSGESLAIEAEGYIDTSKAPVLNINDTVVTGAWESVSVSDNQYVNAVAGFDSVNSDNYPRVAPYSASLSLFDIWNRTETHPVSVTFINGASQKVDVLTGSWETYASFPDEIDNTYKNGWAYKVDFSDCFANGKTLIKLSFEAKGDGTTEYVSDSKQCIRVSNGIYLDVNVPAADLNDGEYHTYSGITDIGGLNRYDSYNVDITTNSHSIYLRKSEGNINFRNIRVEVFNPDSEIKDIVVSRLKITNTLDARFSPNGLMIFGEFDGSQLVDVNYKTVSYTDVYEDNDNDGINETVYYNALGKDETKYVYFTGYESGKDGTSVKAYDSSKTYRAFYWNDFESMMPQIAKNEMK